MALPKLETPTYLMKIPSTQKEIKFRPFLVKEEKILLIAMQEENIDVLFNAVKDIIDNCTFNQLEVRELTTYDIEYIFLQIRIKSKGADIPLSFNCTNEIDLEDGHGPCRHVTTLNFDLNAVSVNGDPIRKKKIIIEEATQIGLIMIVPTFENTKDMQKIMMEEDVHAIYKALPSYIDTIFRGEEVFDDFTPEELEEWIESFLDGQFDKIEDFFDNVPRLSSKVSVTCEGCGHKEEVTIEGLQSFLD